MDLSSILPVSSSPASKMALMNHTKASGTADTKAGKSSSASGSDASISSNRVTSLDQDDFLNLLVVQLTNQNPMEPMADTEFISQMANFSSLEQAQEMQESFDAFSSQQIAMTTQGYLGREVDLKTDSGESVTGVVDEVSLIGDDVQIRIDGVFYDTSAISAVRMQG